MAKSILRILSTGLLLIVSACSALDQGSQGGITITFSNQSNLEVCEIYISVEKANDWGENRLSDAELLAPGASQSLTIKTGTYDLLARSCSQEALYSSSGVNQDYQAVIGGPGFLPIRAVNAGTVEVCHIYLTPSGSAEWGEDQLGRVESLLPGSSRLFFRQPGRYNLRAEDCDHNVLTQAENFDPTGGSEWVINP